MADIALLQKLGVVKQFKKDETLFMQNEMGVCMYITLKGLFGVYINTINGFPLRVAEITQGSYFGEMAVIDGSPRSATIIAEDDCAALVIGHEKFHELLKEAPDIASGIMDSLRNRTLATAETVREAGLEAPDLPPLLRTVQYRDAKSSYIFLKELAKRLREMNDLLNGTSCKKEDKKQPETILTQNTELIKLLPEGYADLGLSDDSNNSFRLRTQKFFCPYCDNEMQAMIPIFSLLGEAEISLDGRAVYKDFDILLYTNIVCPACNYTDTYQEFGNNRSEEQNKYGGDIFLNHEGFTGFSTPLNRNIDEVIKSYYLNIACLERVTNNALRFAKAWIRLYWIYRDNGYKTFALQSAEKAFLYYEKFMENATIPPKDRIRFNAILGELAIYTDDMAKARDYFYQNTLADKNLDKDFLKKSLKRYNEIK